MKKRVLATSDIHGCYRELASVLKVANYNPSCDQLVLLGDYVDRGPDSYEVVKLVMELVSQGAVALKGNHDQMFVDRMKRKSRSSVYDYNGGGATTLSYQKVEASELKRHLEFLQGLPLKAETKDYFFSHAGVDPDKSLKEQTDEDLLWIREDWLYSNKSPTKKTVVFGHSIVNHWFGISDVYVSPGKIGINTGGGCGGYISLVDLSNKISYSIKNPGGKLWSPELEAV